MKQSTTRGRLAAVYVAASVVLVAAMGGVTAIVIDQYRAKARATADALFHEDLRTAMWRMETRVGTMIATTTNRLPEPTAWINPVSNDVNSLEPSPSNVGLSPEVVGAADQAYTLACKSMADSDDTSEVEPVQQLAGRGALRSQQEFQQRSGLNSNMQVTTANRAAGAEFATTVGPLASVWCETQVGLDLYLARRVESPEGVRHESFRLEWAALRATLLAVVVDLFPEAALEPIVDENEIRAFDPDRAAPEEDDAVRLAAIPVRLVVAPPLAIAGLPTALILSLGGAWTALLLALVFGGVALRASFAYGDKHRRFTHAVTHELRTPLTTFRMYSEMLSRGMVPEDKRAEYLATLETESTRLAGLVENVLRYARLEEGNGTPSSETVSVSALVERCMPELARVCAHSDCVLEVRDVVDTGGGEAPALETDGAAVQQILLNLVENACKYGRVETEDAAPSRVVLATSSDDASVHFDVIDSGAGIDPTKRKSIFEPFERAGRDSADPSPGVGLGLALSRDLARELGGRLELLPTTSGATFRLTLPYGQVEVVASTPIRPSASWDRRATTPAQACRAAADQRRGGTRNGFRVFFASRTFRRLGVPRVADACS